MRIRSQYFLGKCDFVLVSRVGYGNSRAITSAFDEFIKSGAVLNPACIVVSCSWVTA